MKNKKEHLLSVLPLPVIQLISKNYEDSRENAKLAYDVTKIYLKKKPELDELERLYLAHQEKLREINSYWSRVSKLEKNHPEFIEIGKKFNKATEELVAIKQEESQFIKSISFKDQYYSIVEDLDLYSPIFNSYSLIILLVAIIGIIGIYFKVRNRKEHLLSVLPLAVIEQNSRQIADLRELATSTYLALRPHLTERAELLEWSNLYFTHLANLRKASDAWLRFGNTERSNPAFEQARTELWGANDTMLASSKKIQDFWDSRLGNTMHYSIVEDLDLYPSIFNSYSLIILLVAIVIGVTIIYLKKKDIKGNLLSILPVAMVERMNTQLDVMKDNMDNIHSNVNPLLKTENDLAEWQRIYDTHQDNVRRLKHVLTDISTTQDGTVELYLRWKKYFEIDKSLQNLNKEKDLFLDKFWDSYSYHTIIEETDLYGIFSYNYSLVVLLIMLFVSWFIVRCLYKKVN